MALYTQRSPSCLENPAILIYNLLSLTPLVKPSFPVSLKINWGWHFTYAFYDNRHYIYIFRVVTGSEIPFLTISICSYGWERKNRTHNFSLGQLTCIQPLYRNPEKIPFYTFKLAFFFFWQNPSLPIVICWCQTMTKSSLVPNLALKYGFCHFSHTKPFDLCWNMRRV